LKVLLITDLYPKDTNHSIKETSWAIHELVRGLSSYGIEIVRVLRPVAEVKWRQFRRNRVNFINEIDNIQVETKSFINIPKKGYFFTKRDLEYFSILLNDIDLVVAHLSNGANIAYKLNKIFKKPYIYVFHNSDLIHIEKNKEVIAHAQNIYSRSWALDRLLHKSNISSDGIVFSGIEKSLITSFREHDNNKARIISVNLLQKLKNIDITIRALSLLQEYNWHYTIIGDGEEYENLNDLIRELKLEHRVKLLGFQKREKCIEEMKKSDIFVMPSSPETFGLAYLEAMASGCLVIGAKGWGIDGLIKNEENGYLVTPRNIEELKSIFIKIFTEEQFSIYQKSYETIKRYTLENAQKNYAKIIYKNRSNREKYRAFCEKQTIPIFSQPWWLDSVCGKDNWDIIVIEKGGNIVATMPLFLRKGKLNTTIISQPLLTQTLGIYFNYPKNQKYYKKLSFEKDIVEKIVKKLPSFDIFSQSFNYEQTNFLPFYWVGFDMQVKYTYVIENISIDELEKNFETDIRRRRRKADKLGVKVYESDDIKKFYELNKMTFIRQNRDIPYSFKFIEKLYLKSKENNACKIFFAKDAENNIIAGNFLIYDKNTVYYLMGGIDPKYKDMGGMDVVLYESIKFALQSGRKFDFEGSMVESIEKYFRSFGAIQKPYYIVYKNNSKLLKIRECIRDIIK